MSSDLHSRLHALEDDSPLLSPDAWAARAARAQAAARARTTRRRAAAAAASALVALAAVMTPVVLTKEETEPAAPPVSGPGTFPRTQPAVPDDGSSVPALADAPIRRAAMLHSVIDWAASDVRDVATGARITARPTAPTGYTGTVVVDVLAYDADGSGWRRLPGQLRRGASEDPSPPDAFAQLSDDGTRTAGGGQFMRPVVVRTFVFATGEQRDYSLDRFGSVRDLRWSPDNRYIAFALGVARPDHTSAERGQRLMLLDTRTGEFRTLAQQVSAPVAWSSDSRRLAAVIGEAGSRAPKQPTLAVIDARSGHVKDLTRRPLSTTGAPVWSRDGRTLWVLGYGSAGRTVLRTVDVDGGGERVEPVPGAGVMPITGRGDAIVVAGGSGLGLLSPETGRTRPLTEVRWSGGSMALGILREGHIR
ncbi:TolB family protein [Motilibacter aurantiacus]|uniref:TolB family protein n=1 Tax=Motilibacter aurantiacus TaxID=2714955 RepID=UPI00140E31A6|nr:hypothetical protein [Motilibacter aurantiacus]NHC44118.1 hypothetical protein [Motilibacter aurantiacus]